MSCKQAHPLLAFVCPGKWSDLVPIVGKQDVRYCMGCRENVHYVRTEQDFQHHREAGDCIAIDTTDRPRPIRIMGSIRMTPPRNEEE